MVSFTWIDISIIVIFFLAVLITGFAAGRKSVSDGDEYLLSGRRVGLFLFILTNVSTWYGGILGVGEFTYRYGLMSWFTQGLPYYIFAILFALFFAEKINKASLYTIPDKITLEYGKTAGLISSVIVFILVSPAPYLLMTASLLSIVFNINILPALIISLLLSMLYLFKGGYKSDLYTDAIQFFVMFIGFFIIIIAAYSGSGGYDFLELKLPADHLSLTGGASPFFILIWFLIALWTFADPGFHQRCYAAKTGRTAKYGIIISVALWALFDFLTTTTGLYSRAILGNINNPVMSFPLLAERILAPGTKGIFYAALFATIMSTLNSFLFLSATTIGRDFIAGFNKIGNKLLKKYTIIGMLVSGSAAVIIAYLLPSVIEIWYAIGSLFIPGIILPVISSYYPRFKVKKNFIITEMIFSVSVAALWFSLRSKFEGISSEIEPMIMGLSAAIIIHIAGLIKKS